jgi:hypothetical protein
MKLCKGCKKEKEFICFSVDKSKEDMLNSICRECSSEKHKEWYKKNKTTVIEKSAVWAKENPEKVKEIKSRWAKRNPKSANKWKRDNPEKKRDTDKAWGAANPQKVKESANKYRRKKRKEDSVFRMRNYASTAVWVELKKNDGNKSGASVWDFLPYTPEELKTHIEGKFEWWMNWQNQGTYKKNKYKQDDVSTWTWQLDHIIPHSKFKYNTMDCQEFKDCWALTNLRPLRAIDNHKKSNK